MLVWWIIGGLVLLTIAEGVFILWDKFGGGKR